MDRKGSQPVWQAVALAAALIAITLNFVQPLAHAALMRSGGPANWAAMCLPAAAQDGDPLPATAGKLHECCLGMAHAPTLAQPPTSYVIAEPLAANALSMAARELFTHVGIRDGPHLPRAPPLSA